MQESYHRYLKGDDTGIAEIVTAYREGLILYAYHFTGSMTAAEDLVDDVFFRLMIKKPHFSGRTSFKTWLYTMTRHRTIDYLRKKKRNPAVSVDEIQELSDKKQLEESYIRKERQIAVYRALRQINASYQLVLHLSFFEDFDNAQIAAILGKSKRQVEMLKYRGLQALKKELEQEGLPDEIL